MRSFARMKENKIEIEQSGQKAKHLVVFHFLVSTSLCTVQSFEMDARANKRDLVSGNSLHIFYDYLVSPAPSFAKFSVFNGFSFSFIQKRIETRKLLKIKLLKLFSNPSTYLLCQYFGKYIFVNWLTTILFLFLLNPVIDFFLSYLNMNKNGNLFKCFSFEVQKWTCLRDRITDIFPLWIAIKIAALSCSFLLHEWAFLFSFAFGIPFCTNKIPPCSQRKLWNSLFRFSKAQKFSS